MYRFSSFGDFRCTKCGAFVTSAHQFSGVNNRNHCPYCLWSSHLDLYTSGDRLSACKGPMKPIGLTMKKSRNKYRPESSGELMMIHECIECTAISINRIAADDDTDSMFIVFRESLIMLHRLHRLCKPYEIVPLDHRDLETVDTQLFGRNTIRSSFMWEATP